MRGRTSNESDDPHLLKSSLQELSRISELAGFRELSISQGLAWQDADAAVAKLRKLTECLCKKIVGIEKGNLRDIVEMIERQELVSAQAIARLQYIRKLGNIAVHEGRLESERFTIRDVTHVADALILVTDEAMRRGVLPD